MGVLTDGDFIAKIKNASEDIGYLKRCAHTLGVIVFFSARFLLTMVKKSAKRLNIVSSEGSLSLVQIFFPKTPPLFGVGIKLHFVFVLGNSSDGKRWRPSVKLNGLHFLKGTSVEAHVSHLKDPKMMLLFCFLSFIKCV